jgi:hypothetical protein
MPSNNNVKKYLLIIGKILILLMVAIGAMRSGSPASYFDPFGILLVLVGGVVLVVISFPGTEILRAFRHAAGGSGSDADLGNSAHFWEAAGRGFWILGGLCSVLSMIMGFVGMSKVEFTSMSVLITMLVRALLSIFYGGLLAVICFVPCWKLQGILQSLLSESGMERGEKLASIERPARRFGSVFGGVLFLAAPVATARMIGMDFVTLWTVFIPPLMVVLGGTLALILFMGGNTKRLTTSAAFAGMGLLACLMGFIQMLYGMTDPGPQGIGNVAGALAFILTSCFTALLGMVLIGAPLEDRAIRTGKTGAPSAFSRVAWYVFPLLSLIFLILVFNMIILPLPPS